MTKKLRITCPNDASHDSWYAGGYDRFGCFICDIWTDKACGCSAENPCEFSKAFADDGSPERPSLATKLSHWSGIGSAPYRNMIMIPKEQAMLYWKVMAKSLRK